MREDTLIQTFFARLSEGRPEALGLIDDAAWMRPTPGQDFVVTADTLIAGVHFFANDAPEDIAIKALGVNLSDLAAKGADPLFYLLCLALPPDLPGGWLAGLADGLASAQAASGIVLIGGDTTRSPSPLMISITAIGTVPTGAMVQRSGARPGDRLYVTGTIGDAALGLRLRSGDPDCADWPMDAERRAFLRDRYARPRPRTKLAPALRRHATAALDVSDGLLLDASRLCRASGVCATIEAARVPFSQTGEQLAAQPKWLEIMLSGGDDYELLMAVPEREADALSRAAFAAGIGAITRIGEITAATADPSPDDPVRVIGPDGAALTFSRRGYDHFD
jgi:thiamine-monophosphate kinase